MRKVVGLGSAFRSMGGLGMQITCYRNLTTITDQRQILERSIYLSVPYHDIVFANSLNRDSFTNENIE